MGADTRRDFAVAGGGIAGLAISELLQRSGASVVLIEKNKTLCSEASGEQQGWFHTGALYTALPDQFFFRAMVGNLDDLIDYYRGFPSMNLRVDKHVSSASSEGWFSNRTNFYAYTSCKGVSWKWKIPWFFALQRAKRRMSWFETLDASRSLSRQMNKVSKPLNFVLHTPPLGVKLNEVAFVLKSRDRAMNTRLIIEDLLRSFLGHGGLIKTETKVRSIDEGCVTADATSAEGPVKIRARHIILTTGKGSTVFSPNIRAVMSPLLVVCPALVDINFIKMSPDMKDTINHIYHRFNGLDYSLIGNAAYHDPEDCTGRGENRFDVIWWRKRGKYSATSMTAERRFTLAAKQKSHLLHFFGIIYITYLIGGHIHWPCRASSLSALVLQPTCVGTSG